MNLKIKFNKVNKKIFKNLNPKKPLGIPNF